MLEIRPFEESDWKLTWQIMEPVFRSGDTHPFYPDISEKDAYHAWIELPMATYVALKNGAILGTYHMKENQKGLGSHVCNCGYVVDPNARNQGVGSELLKHSEKTAIEKGFLAMQFNLVVETNIAALNLWKKHGFQTIGALPGAFRHKDLGFVDAFVMYKTFVEKL